MENITLALDWTPNINHIGFFVAHEKGFYQDQALQVNLLSPAADHYAVTPAKKVELGEAELALCPTESVISYRTKKSPFDLIGIATIFQEDLSAIAVRTDSGISRPKQLDGKRYASYKARYEDEIVKQMICNDGGRGDLQLAYPDKLGIWDTLLRGSYDATWIFLNWEGVEATTLEAGLTYFKMADYQVPYSYSPLLVASETAITAHQAVYRRFLAASREGFLYAAAHPEEAVALLKPHVPVTDTKIDLNEALRLSAKAFGDKETWGKMDTKQVATFLDWLHQHNLESQQPEVSQLVTNDLL